MPPENGAIYPQLCGEFETRQTLTLKIPRGGIVERAGNAKARMTEPPEQTAVFTFSHSIGKTKQPVDRV
jgi:hypothetical protein